jgi:hypothetical protein
MLNSLMTPRGVKRRQRTEVTSVDIPATGPRGMREIFGAAERGVQTSRLPPVSPYGLFQPDAPANSSMVADASFLRAGALAPLDARARRGSVAKSSANKAKVLVKAAPPYLRDLAREIAPRANGPDCALGSVPFTQVFSELGASDADAAAGYKLIKELKGRVTLGATIEVFDELLTSGEVSAHVTSKCFAVLAPNSELAIDKGTLDMLRRSITLPRGVTFEMVMAVDRAVRTRPREATDTRQFISEAEFCRLLTDPDDVVASQLVCAFSPTILHVLVTTFR